MVLDRKDNFDLSDVESVETSTLVILVPLYFYTILPPMIKKKIECRCDNITTIGSDIFFLDIASHHREQRRISRVIKLFV